MSLNVILLAAGQGKRMHSDTPKVLHRLAGRPLLGRVIDTARALGATKIVVVHGHGGEQVSKAFASDAGLVWAEQKEQLGTGHAVMQGLPHVDSQADVLVLYGDVPLIEADSLRRLVEAARGGGGLAIMTAVVEDAALKRLVNVMSLFVRCPPALQPISTSRSGSAMPFLMRASTPAITSRCMFLKYPPTTSR